MDTDAFITEAARVVARLAALDRRRVAFGARAHRYAFAPPLPEATAAAFEDRHGLRLPAPYRAFLTRLGDGGAGPFHGVLPLDRASPAVARPFPHTAPVDLPDDALSQPLDGVVRLADCGCGTWAVLVVRGEAAGQVWWDARYESGLAPALDAEGGPATFDRWWLDEMAPALARFEAVAALMEARVDHEEIHARLGPRHLQLDVDQAMASLMDAAPSGTPRRVPDKPWGLVCGQVDELYAAWLDRARGS